MSGSVSNLDEVQIISAALVSSTSLTTQVSEDSLVGRNSDVMTWHRGNLLFYNYEEIISVMIAQVISFM